MAITFKYTSDNDRAYGLSGMVVCMGLMEQENFIDSVSLDADPDEGLKFTPDFFYMPNQHLSPKAVWHDNVSHFKLLSGLLVSNVLCRALVQHKVELNRQMSDLMLKYLKDEGQSMCQLHDDEISDIYSKTYRYFHHAFGHPLVAELVADIVAELNSRRHFEGEEAGRLLRRLRRSW